MLTYAQLEMTLVSHLGVAPKERTKFVMRIKQLQRLHWPSGVNNGGKRMVYDATHLLELTIVFELIQLGLPPKRAIELVKMWWADLRRAFLRARDHPYPILFAFLQGDFARLLDKAASKDRKEGMATIGVDPADSATKMRHSLTVLAQSRACLVNISDVLAGLTEGLNQAGVESAFFWAQTETWRSELDQEQDTSLGKKT